MWVSWRAVDQAADPARASVTNEPDPPSRWGAVGAIALGLLFWFMVFLVFKINGRPGGYGFFEVVILPVAVGGWFIGRGLFLLWKGRA
jgi:hypothetical protein